MPSEEALIFLAIFLRSFTHRKTTEAI